MFLQDVAALPFSQIDMVGSGQYQNVEETVAAAQSEQTTSDRPNTNTSQNHPATFEIPGNQEQGSQDHYQQLNPATLQHDPTAQYEPLRIKNATGTDIRNDTYEPLRTSLVPPSVEYQSLLKNSFC